MYVIHLFTLESRVNLYQSEDVRINAIGIPYLIGLRMDQSFGVLDEVFWEDSSWSLQITS